MRKRHRMLAAFALLVIAHLTTAAQQHAPAPAVAAAATKADDVAFSAVESVHGMAGPFAVAGYRMGARALDELGLLKGSFALRVHHEAPAEVQWSCIVDGLQAATGASLGKLNLTMTSVPDASRVASFVTDQKSGTKIVFRLQESFLKRFLNVPVADLRAAGRAALTLKDEEIFRFEFAGPRPTRRNPFDRRTNEPPAARQ